MAAIMVIVPMAFITVAYVSYAKELRNEEE